MMAWSCCWWLDRRSGSTRSGVTSWPAAQRTCSRSKPTSLRPPILFIRSPNSAFATSTRCCSPTERCWTQIVSKPGISCGRHLSRSQTLAYTDQLYAFILEMDHVCGSSNSRIGFQEDSNLIYLFSKLSTGVEDNSLRGAGNSDGERRQGL